MEEGVIKYNCHWKKCELQEFPHFSELNNWRNKLHQTGLIGVNADQIGYGNISMSTGSGQFLISGSATGHINILTKDQYSLVTAIDQAANTLWCEGPLKASSESMTHGAIYQCGTQVHCVVHVHHLDMWKYFMHKWPCTDARVPYGTPEMANEIIRLFEETNVAQQKKLVMGGHEEGLISFGSTIDEACEIMMEAHAQWQANM